MTSVLGVPGVAGHYPAAGFVQAPGNGLVADEKLFFHAFFSLFIYDLQKFGGFGTLPKKCRIFTIISIIHENGGNFKSCHPGERQRQPVF